MYLCSSLVFLYFHSRKELIRIYSTLHIHHTSYISRYIYGKFSESILILSMQKICSYLFSPENCDAIFVSSHLCVSLRRHLEKRRERPSLYIGSKKFAAAFLALKRRFGPREGAFFNDLAADPRVLYIQYILTGLGYIELSVPVLGFPCLQ